VIRSHIRVGIRLHCVRETIVLVPAPQPPLFAGELEVNDPSAWRLAVIFGGVGNQLRKSS